MLASKYLPQMQLALIICSSNALIWAAMTARSGMMLHQLYQLSNHPEKDVLVVWHHKKVVDNLEHFQQKVCIYAYHHFFSSLSSLLCIYRLSQQPFTNSWKQSPACLQCHRD